MVRLLKDWADRNYSSPFDTSLFSLDQEPCIHYGFDGVLDDEEESIRVFVSCVDCRELITAQQETVEQFVEE